MQPTCNIGDRVDWTYVPAVQANVSAAFKLMWQEGGAVGMPICWNSP